MLNKLRCHTYSNRQPVSFSWSKLLIQIYIINAKQCRSRSVQKPSDLDLYCWQRQGISGLILAGLGLILSQNIVYVIPMTLEQLCRYDAVLQFPFPSTIREWNNLLLECRNSDSVNYFNMNEGSVIVPIYYNSGNSRSRRFHILHTRLRTNCSALNNNLFLKRSDFPFCPCGATENVLHLELSAVGPPTCRTHTHCLPTYHRKPSRYFIWGQPSVYSDKKQSYLRQYINRIFGTNVFKFLPY